MNALLSIKPKYVKEIIKGNKKYEFRKAIFKRRVKKVYIYSSSPIKKIVGVFFLSEIIRDKPKILWINLKDVSGIEKTEFFNYFKGKSEGFAIEINNLRLFDHPIDPKNHFEKFTPPQSFFYFDDAIFNQAQNL